MLNTLLRYLTLIILLFATNAVLSAQDINLANQYYANGEYEKAATLFEQLLDKNPGNDFVVNRYVECMINLERFSDGEKTMKQLIKKNQSNGNLHLQYGNLMDRQGKTKEAEEAYDKAISTLSPDFNSVYRLANQFSYASKFDLAVRTYERGAELLKDKTVFALNLAELYRRKGETDLMLEQFLNSLLGQSGRLQSVQINLSRYLDPADFPKLQTKLYTRIQEDENPDYIELLAWSFVQVKDYKNALRQLKALDQRLGENGSRVYRLGQDAARDKDFDAAISAFQYIVQEKGQQNAYFFVAQQGLTSARRDKITEGYNFAPEDLIALETEYNNFLTAYGMNRQTAEIVLEMAELEALYVNNLPRATALLDSLIVTPGLERDVHARAKIDLADYYLMQGERWESTLLYSQVDKDFKEEVIGQEARFKNAKLAYYNGDFQWAQAQFDVLKASTSKLIANDALDLSVFIMDNLNLDTTADAITLYAGAELLVFQNRFDEALLRLDTLQRNFPEHSLQDDIFYLEAQIAEKRTDFAKAAKLYEKVAEKFPEDIRADNALFALAQLCENRLNDPEKAQTLYEKIFTDYSGSVFAVEARKRYRILRGDKVQ